MGAESDMWAEMSDAEMKSLADMSPKPRAMPKAVSRIVSRSAFMLRQRKARRQSSRTLTDRIRLNATSAVVSLNPRCRNEIEEKVRITLTMMAQWKMTMPTFINPGNEESAER